MDTLQFCLDQLGDQKLPVNLGFHFVAIVLVDHPILDLTIFATVVGITTILTFQIGEVRTSSVRTLVMSHEGGQ